MPWRSDTTLRDRVADGRFLSRVYGFLSGAWPFGVIEVIWRAIAFRR